MASASRKIILCADDYGLSPGVNRGIRELLDAGRLNATSVMVLPPSFVAQEVAALQYAAGQAQIGLHVTLTAPFAPLTKDFMPTRDGAFLPLAVALQTAAVTRRYHIGVVAKEVAAQMRRFTEAFGKSPDYVDGHQHVQLFPQIREAVLKVVAELAPKAWVRQCGRQTSIVRRVTDHKGLLLDILSVAVRRKARRLGLTTNPAFAGTYSFQLGTDYPTLFSTFLDGLPDSGLVMCHPGYVDAELERLDSLTSIRERELAFFKSAAFSTLLATKGVTLF